MKDFISAEVLSKLDSRLTDFFAEGRSPGLVYGLAVRGELIHWKAVGQATIGKQVCTRTTAFRVASLTKSFTAMAVLKLRDLGLINLDAPFVTYTPDLNPQQIEFFEVTVRHLLTMSAGFPTDNEWADRVESISDVQFLELMNAGFRFDSHPGTRFEYSNLGYALLARIISNVSKMSYVQYVTQEIFFALGLRNTTFDFTDSHELAKGYAKLDQWVEEPHQGPGAFSSIGGVITTLDDLVAWSHYLSSAFNPSTPEQGPLKSSSRREMQSISQSGPEARGGKKPSEYQGPQGYGFGLRVEENIEFGKIAGHTGGYPGFGTHMAWHCESGLSIFALANGRYADPVDATLPALREVLTVLPKKALVLTLELEFARSKVLEIITAWDESTTNTFFAVNMDLDYPREFRKDQISQALIKTGTLTAQYELLESYNRSHLKWLQHGEKKSLQIEIWLAPLAPLQLQVLKVSAVDFFHTGLNKG